MREQHPAAEGTIIEASELPLDPTGVPNLDLLLGGGLIRGTLALVVGPPGCGKTTLAAQIAFAAARAGRRALILTALSEPSSKLLAHLRGYEFFDAGLLGEGVRVLSLQQYLAAGLASAAEAVVALAREGQANLVVLDGFNGVGSVDADPGAARQFLYSVGATLGLQGTTTLITAEAEVRDPLLFTEATTADTILGLHFSVRGERQHRRIEVVKARGAAPLPGLHGLALSAAGAVIAPRLEARVVRAHADAAAGAARAAPADDLEARATFGLPALDELLGGGLSRATTTLVLGSGGTGKTLLGLQFAVAGAQAGEPVVFLGFHEDQRQLLRKADAFNLGQGLRAALAPGGGLTLLHRPPVELEADALADRLLTALDRTGARRLVVDSVAVLERAVSEESSPQRVLNYLSALTGALQARGVTALFTKEIGPFAGSELELETDLSSGVAENVLWLQGVIYRQGYYRVLSVLKMRYSAHDLTLREFTISAPTGIAVRALGETAGGVLTGIARRQSDPWGEASPSGSSVRTRRQRERRPQDADRPPGGI